ncbi:MAG: GDP-mannose 4,6-dehydratase [Candidatus Magasanikbacteria bacterium RIFCSPHIGHO2_01_FULL_33_34]|uniref:GDP-mannose 4,6-dehydratase n=1 Tax=Candidatus Magasanikbacteria bacterium RIFCSPHIGHO2_01_FULL_33_34 TaxID=1798671 RepID=A0A1F6LJF7_9BACT|nr:MAG: GDP-mannose 4,6-dehydratase [Candidatus Magasanikbacteria bacterium RIFCSPHIGHO2_01_FULL_33_34]OGH65397.1 MAG: GDP-mannose 4,6-dehydratase [Candidatus Magasanikbacteria bacterium RIFCSPHIGHO2_02_FULL_33_17]OGH76303.1 MAG: GDP-mannose 4,6-dehydratase [Candidatus Magasanikbacteria bacterium RIFCSPLOWO2_01_FULL_33_34]OGH81086.1 MAG: GDP-mannose 4,6-dehydratase [Candidatus Magasanikbacteria bacterium RIFCSPLOWO2_12_FULL_34_7]
MKKAFITGITGQDGSYLTELLLEKGYEVHGIVRRNSILFRSRIEHLFEKYKDKKLFLYYGDLSDGTNISKLLYNIQPDEIYNLAAQSHVRISFDIPAYTADITGVGVIRLLEAIKDSGIKTKFYQASSSEMYGKVSETPQNEKTCFHPRSPYACAKVFAHHQTINYRESYGMFACSGILFNHESPRRGENFVTKKITKGVAEIKNGLSNKIILGNLDSKRDWGYAKEYVEAMWLMLQQDEPDDYVIATGETHTVREFLEEAFGFVNLNWEDYVEFDERFLRPAEVDLLVGDYSKAKEKLGWEPKVKFKELVKLMVEADLEAISQ